MMKVGKYVIKNHMTLDYAFTGIRIQDSALTPVDWILQIDVVVPFEKGKSMSESESKASYTYQKLYFWLDTNLPSFIAVDVNNEDDFYIASMSSNIVMYCPGNPGDDLLIQLIHTKLTTLADNHLVIGEIRLRGSDTSMRYTFDCTEAENALPKTIASYCKSGTARDKDPWWFRNDGFCFEFIKPEDSAISDEELFGDITDPMAEFERIISEMSAEDMAPVKEPARIVQVDKWKPKKIE
jgi:hypothetical protein